MKKITQNKFSNLLEMVDYAKSSYKNPKALNFVHNKKWQCFSHQEFADNIEIIALALKELDLKKGRGLGITANSSPIWLMMNFATMAIGALSVPIFANISQENLLFEIKDAKIEFFFCDDKENLEILLKSEIKYKKIIIFGFKYEKRNKDIISFENLLKLGTKIRKNAPDSYKKLTKKIKEDDLATIIYTSGSTGVPKGVEITHKNLISQINGAEQYFPLEADKDIALSFLPLAHIFENMVMSFFISKGITVYFANNVGDVGTLLQKTRPTLMTVVPRMLEKTYSKMEDRLEDASAIKKFIGKMAFKLALKTNPEIKKIPFHGLFDKLVYQKLTQAMGGNMRMMICGGAALSKDLEQFFNNIGIDLYVGYGLTEFSPVIAVNHAKAHKIGTVGELFPGVEAKIKKGELFVRGDSVMRGYHNDPEKTAKAIDKNGWLDTGDLAKIEGKFLTILGRKKELFKTSGGKYVSPVPIEQKIMQQCSFLNGALVVAENRKFVSCLVFFDFDSIDFYKKKFRQESLSNEEFLKSPTLHNKIKAAIVVVNQSLNEWEKVRKFELITNKISIENGEITPSMKLKRNILEAKYKKVIDKFYS